jgi:hypothetical protein
MTVSFLRDHDRVIYIFICMRDTHTHSLSLFTHTHAHSHARTIFVLEFRESISIFGFAVRLKMSLSLDPGRGVKFYFEKYYDKNVFFKYSNHQWSSQKFDLGGANSIFFCPKMSQNMRF